MSEEKSPPSPPSSASPPSPAAPSAPPASAPSQPATGEKPPDRGTRSSDAPRREERSDRGPRGERSDRGPRGERSDRGPRGERGGGGPRGRRRFRRGKVCRFCVNKVIYIDYKEVEQIRRYLTDRGKILPRRITGNCARHQRMVARAIKRARNIALIPFKAK